jgi:hypothetical protein
LVCEAGFEFLEFDESVMKYEKYVSGGEYSWDKNIAQFLIVGPPKAIEEEILRRRLGGSLYTLTCWRRRRGKFKLP